MAPKERYLFYFVKFWEKKQHFKDNNADCSSTESDSFTYSDQ